MAAFTFREFEVPDALRVELADDDAPYGRPQDLAAFETGGELVRKRVKLPGRRAPLFHVLHADDRPLVVKGAFRDYRMGVGHARAMRSLLERVRERGNLLRITWGGRQWTGLLGETLFGEEGDGHVTYEITFDIGLPPETSAAQPPPPLATSDSLSRVRANLLARPPIPARARNIVTSLTDAFAAVDNAMERAEDAVRLLETARKDVFRQVRRVTSLNSQVQQVVSHAMGIISRTRAEGAGIVQHVKEAVEWQTYSSTTIELLRDVQAVMRDAAESARKRQRGATKLYRVKVGDTLESIALQQLGDAGRAGDLGVVGGLTPGSILRLPASGAAS